MRKRKQSKMEKGLITATSAPIVLGGIGSIITKNANFILLGYVATSFIGAGSSIIVSIREYNGRRKEIRGFYSEKYKINFNEIDDLMKNE